jgi:hypothetical protein
MNKELKDLVETKVSESIGRDVILRNVMIEEGKYVFIVQINGIGYKVFLESIWLESKAGIENFLKDLSNKLLDMLEDEREVIRGFFNEFEIDITDDKVINFIELLKGTDLSTRELMEEMYLRGDCGRFHVILRSVFPDAKAYVFNGDYFMHVISKIDDKFYDIKGEVTLERFKGLEGYEILDNVGKLEDGIREARLSELLEGDMFNNYSFEARGAIL